MFFVVVGWLPFVVCCSMCVACCALFVVGWLLLAVCVRCLLFVVSCLYVCCVLFVVCCLLVFVAWWVFGVRSLVFCDWCCVFDVVCR